jgi:hypothetical protein
MMPTDLPNDRRDVTKQVFLTLFLIATLIAAVATGVTAICVYANLPLYMPY